MLVFLHEIRRRRVRRSFETVPVGSRYSRSPNPVCQPWTHSHMYCRPVGSCSYNDGKSVFPTQSRRIHHNEVSSMPRTPILPPSHTMVGHPSLQIYRCRLPHHLLHLLDKIVDGCHNHAATLSTGWMWVACSDIFVCVFFILILYLSHLLLLQLQQQTMNCSGLISTHWRSKTLPYEIFQGCTKPPNRSYITLKSSWKGSTKSVLFELIVINHMFLNIQQKMAPSIPGWNCIMINAILLPTLWCPDRIHMLEEGE